jgi:excisionase family DNA binding protein
MSVPLTLDTAALLRALATEDPEALRPLAEALRPLLAPERRRSPWLTPEQAAELLGCKRRRIYDLVSDGRLTRHRDGPRRLLLDREEVMQRVSAG